MLVCMREIKHWTNELVLCARKVAEGCACAPHQQDEACSLNSL
jgi:hypothetical protein